jgi:hypothetical protein
LSQQRRLGIAASPLRADPFELEDIPNLPVATWRLETVLRPTAQK